MITCFRKIVVQQVVLRKEDMEGREGMNNVSIKIWVWLSFETKQAVTVPVYVRGIVVGINVSQPGRLSLLTLLYRGTYLSFHLRRIWLRQFLRKVFRLFLRDFKSSLGSDEFDDLLDWAMLLDHLLVVTPALAGCFGSYLLGHL